MENVDLIGTHNFFTNKRATNDGPKPNHNSQLMPEDTREAWSLGICVCGCMRAHSVHERQCMRVCVYLCTLSRYVLSTN